MGEYNNRLGNNDGAWSTCLDRRQYHVPAQSCLLDCAKTSNTLTFSLHNESRKICQFCEDKEVERIKGGSEYGNLRVCAPLWGGDRCGINFPDSDMVF